VALAAKPDRISDSVWGFTMRRSFLFLALLLVMGVGLFVALVMVPQIRQSQRTTAGAALLGLWKPDIEATWAQMLVNVHGSDRDKMSRAMEPLRTMLNAQYNSELFQFTADKLILKHDGKEGIEMRYEITSANGDVISGKASYDLVIPLQFRFTLSGDILYVFFTNMDADKGLIFRRVSY
jgi:hypothetical protein